MHSDIQTAAVTIINIDVTPFIVYSSKYKPARVMPWVSPYSKGEDGSHISCVPPTYLCLWPRSKLYTTRAIYWILPVAQLTTTGTGPSGQTQTPQECTCSAISYNTGDTNQLTHPRLWGNYSIMYDEIIYEVIARKFRDFVKPFWDLNIGLYMWSIWCMYPANTLQAECYFLWQVRPAKLHVFSWLA